MDVKKIFIYSDISASEDNPYRNHRLLYHYAREIKVHVLVQISPFLIYFISVWKTTVLWNSTFEYYLLPFFVVDDVVY